MEHMEAQMQARYDAYNDALKQSEDLVVELLNALKLAEAVYRKNVVAPGEPSSVLDAMQAAISKAEGRS